MTRRYKPTSIQATHAVTQREEWLRERERPKTPREATPAPANREAAAEPDPVAIPKHGRPPKNLVVQASIPDDMILMRTEEVDVLLSMADETFARESGRVKRATDPLPRVRRDPKLTTRRRNP